MDSHGHSHDHSGCCCCFGTLLKVVAVVVAVYVARWIFKRKEKNERLSSAISRFRDSERANQARLVGRLDAKRADKQAEWDKIQAMDMESLLSSLRSGSVTAVDAMQAFQDRAININKELNCITHFLEDAESESERLDLLPASERGPLHGLPVSIKECYKIKGCQTTTGLAHLLGDPSSEDALVVEQLRRLGAVPFVHTNIPQTMYSLQSSNPIYGATGNPYDPSRECGGSSGGEGSLVGAGGSLVGVGNDIGGSVRSPAAMCGAYSLKPTVQRTLTQIGSVAPYPAAELVLPKVAGGFLCTSAKALADASRIFTGVNQSTIDPNISPVTWNEERFASTKPLRIGYFRDLGSKTYQPHPASARAVDEAVALLKARGHTLVEFAAPDMSEVCRLYTGFINMDFNAGIGEALSKDLYDSATLGMRGLSMLGMLPGPVRDAINRLVATITLMDPPAYFSDGVKLRHAIRDQSALRASYLKAMRDSNLDCLVTLGALFPAPVKGTMGETVVSVYPYIPWNLLDFPAGIAPVAQLTEEDDDKMNNEYPKSDMVVGKPFDDEVVLRVLGELEAAAPKLVRDKKNQ